ncbi:MAG: T9SS type A sorting domain-containing protein [Lewinellaceae bacterium]|nr:T9SS type A sorting domain-containing protein [Lewinellaceae bacterium]
MESRGEPTEVANYWNVDPTQYEYSMTLVGMLHNDGQNATSASHELGAFAGNELRGSVQAIYVEPLNAHLFFLTVFANASGEQLAFKLYNNATGQVQELAENMYFAANLQEGAIEDPKPFTLKTSGLPEVDVSTYLEVKPNPFHRSTTILFSSTQAQDLHISITDVAGRIVFRQKIAAAAGVNKFRWEAGDLQSGVYFVRMETPEGTAVKKVVKE